MLHRPYWLYEGLHEFRISINLWFIPTVLLNNFYIKNVNLVCTLDKSCRLEHLKPFTVNWQFFAFEIGGNELKLSERYFIFI